MNTLRLDNELWNVAQQSAFNVTQLSLKHIEKQYGFKNWISVLGILSLTYNFWMIDIWEKIVQWFVASLIWVKNSSAYENIEHLYVVFRMLRYNQIGTN